MYLDHHALERRAQAKRAEKKAEKAAAASAASAVATPLTTPTSANGPNATDGPATCQCKQFVAIQPYDVSTFFHPTANDVPEINENMDDAFFAEVNFNF